MKITLNGLENPENIITFTNCPTILTVSDTWTGTRALTTISLKTGNVLSSSSSGTYVSENIPITINGYSISSTQDINKAIGTKYYMPKTITSSNMNIVANSITNALRNIGALSSKYKIYQVINGTSVSSSVRIEAIQQGIMTTTISVDRALKNVITTTTTNGSISSIFNGSTRNKICIDIYNVNIPTKIGGGTTTNISYLTTLEKNVYNSDISFDLSPIFNNYVNEGSISQFQVVNICSSWICSQSGELIHFKIYWLCTCTECKTWNDKGKTEQLTVVCILSVSDIKSVCRHFNNDIALYCCLH